MRRSIRDQAIQMSTQTAPADEIHEISEVALTTIAPLLRSYAIGILRSASNADDAVQDTLERAWRARQTFKPGAKLKPWLFTILRNAIVDRQRQGRRLTEDVEGAAAATLASQPDQIWRLQFVDAVLALEILTDKQKQALLLVAFGATTAEAAALMSCPLGTLKSHLRLARGKLKAAGV